MKLALRTALMMVISFACAQDDAIEYDHLALQARVVQRNETDVEGCFSLCVNDPRCTIAQYLHTEGCDSDSCCQLISDYNGVSAVPKTTAELLYKPCTEHSQCGIDFGADEGAPQFGFCAGAGPVDSREGICRSCSECDRPWNGASPIEGTECPPCGSDFDWRTAL